MGAHLALLLTLEQGAVAMLVAPAMPGLLQQIGLMKYWRTTHTRPDVCSVKDPPPFCRMI